jgi:uncharacterized OsmC-like protein
MSASEHLHSHMERSIKALTLRPAVGKRTAVSTARVTDGVACEIEEGRWKLTADLSEKGGGTGTGPDPGVLGRAALGSCMAMGIRQWAAYLGVPVSSVEVVVEADFDVGAQYGVGDCPPGYTEVRYTVTVESEADEAEVMQCVEKTQQTSPWLDVFARGQKMVGAVNVRAPKE